MEKIYIGWKEYDKMITALSSQILKTNIKYDLILTFPRGGLPIATSLAHKLKIKDIITVEQYLIGVNEFNDYTKNKVLLVDDISDTGNTLEKIFKRTGFKNTDFDIACLCYKPHTSIKPKYFAKVYLNDEYVVFPWEEKENENMKREISRDFRHIMKTMNLDLNDESLQETPDRVAKMYVNEIFEGLFNPEPKFTVFNNFENYDQIITNSATIFSTCEHHFVSIKMRIHIGYIPDKKCCGISKLIRIAEWYAHRPQVQERLTQQIANYLMNQLNPKGVMIVIEGEHMCEQMRGIKKVDSIMRTSAIKGIFKDKDVRDEFMALIYGGK